MKNANIQPVSKKVKINISLILNKECMGFEKNCTLLINTLSPIFNNEKLPHYLIYPTL